MLPPLM
ncbi:hypothetical protein R3I93_016929 [Phoxinus phoxinus]